MEEINLMPHSITVQFILNSYVMLQCTIQEKKINTLNYALWLIEDPPKFCHNSDIVAIPTYTSHAIHT